MKLALILMFGHLTGQFDIMIIGGTSGRNKVSQLMTPVSASILHLNAFSNVSEDNNFKSLLMIQFISISTF